MDDRRLLIVARAKLNLTLDILGRRPDGYHDLESVVQSIDLYDGIALGSTSAHTVSGQGRELGVTLACQHPLVPLGQENLAFRAALALSRHTGVGAAVWIDIKKKIPVSAGLGGGSADAAAVLFGLNELWGLGLDEDELCAIGETVGADVPFCLTGGTAVIRGKGEEIERLPALENVWFVVIVPEGGISTAEAYAGYDRRAATAAAGDCGGAGHATATRAVIEAVAGRDVQRIASGLANDLGKTAETMVPAVRDAKKALLEAGALGVEVSGSGPAVFGIAEDEKAARQIRRIVRQSYDTTFVCCSAPKGLESVSVRQWTRHD